MRTDPKSLQPTTNLRWRLTHAARHGCDIPAVLGHRGYAGVAQARVLLGKNWTWEPRSGRPRRDRRRQMLGSKNPVRRQNGCCAQSLLQLPNVEGPFVPHERISDFGRELDACCACLSEARA